MKPLDMVVTRMGLRFGGRRFACTVGRGGVVADKREGDGGTPVGVHRIVGMLYRPDRMVRPAKWAVPIGPSDLWSDDVRDPHYNHMVRLPHGFGHEVLHRADPMYDLILIVGWNWPHAEPGRGSAIFVHRWRRPGASTAGCVALAAPDLLWVAQRLLPQSRLIIR